MKSVQTHTAESQPCKSQPHHRRGGELQCREVPCLFVRLCSVVLCCCVYKVSMWPTGHRPGVRADDHFFPLPCFFLVFCCMPKPKRECRVCRVWCVRVCGVRWYCAYAVRTRYRRYRFSISLSMMSCCSFFFCSFILASAFCKRWLLCA